MTDPPLDDATVEAIAAEMTHDDATKMERDYALLFVRRWAPIFAKHLPDPRPTEAEVRKVLMDYWDWNNVTRVLRHLGCFRPEAGDSDA